MRVLKLLPLLLITFLLASCASTVKINVTSARYINPDVNNTPLPVQVKVFELTNKQSFLSASFNDLWRNASSALGSSLLDSQSVMVSPSSKTSVRIDRNKKARYIGVVAIFRRPGMGNWRAVTKIPSRAGAVFNSVDIYVEGSSVRVGTS